MKPVSLSIIDVAIMVILVGQGRARVGVHDKALLAKHVLSALQDPELVETDVTFRLNRLLDLRLIQEFGSEFMVTPRGNEALGLARIRMKKLVALSGF